MVTFIIRRLIATIFLLIVVSMTTYAIFFLIPRLAGQTTYQLATQYVGRNPTRAAVLQIEQKLGIGDPIYVQYGRFLRGLVFGEHFNTGTSTAYCPPPCFGYSFKSEQPVWPLMVASMPVTISLVVGAAISPVKKIGSDTPARATNIENRSNTVPRFTLHVACPPSFAMTVTHSNCSDCPPRGCAPSITQR